MLPKKIRKPRAVIETDAAMFDKDGPVENVTRRKCLRMVAAGVGAAATVAILPRISVAQARGGPVTFEDVNKLYKKQMVNVREIFDKKLTNIIIKKGHYPIPRADFVAAYMQFQLKFPELTSDEVLTLTNETYIAMGALFEHKKESKRKGSTRAKALLASAAAEFALPKPKIVGLEEARNIVETANENIIFAYQFLKSQKGKIPKAYLVQATVSIAKRNSNERFRTVLGEVEKQHNYLKELQSDDIFLIQPRGKPVARALLIRAAAQLALLHPEEITFKKAVQLLDISSGLIGSKLSIDDDVHLVSEAALTSAAGQLATRIKAQRHLDIEASIDVARKLVMEAYNDTASLNTGNARTSIKQAWIVYAGTTLALEIMDVKFADAMKVVKESYETLPLKGPGRILANTTLVNVAAFGMGSALETQGVG